MNFPDTLAPWLAPLGWLALEAAVVVLAALAVQPLLRTAAARRSLWRAVLVALGLLLAAELTGTGSQLPAQLRLAWQTTFPAPVPPPISPAPFTPAPAEPLPISDLPSPILLEPFPEPLPFIPEPPAPAPPPSLHHSITPPPPTPWPAFLWLTGLTALLARSAWTHAGFAWLRLRHFVPAAEALRERVQSLAARLALRRRVRVLASERLRAPAAFGWVRPGVGVPGDFTARFASAQQDVMLAHELAHLAARDPLWQLLADLVTAALWWHPLAWVARRQHRLAGELAADDASLALPDGPVVLAECLLTLGHEAADCPRAALGMAGFRSQLGRRVERLLALPRRDWQAPSRARLALQTAAALLALAALALLPGCAANRSASEAPSGILAKWWQAKKATAPVGDDVRSLQSNAERGVRNTKSGQSLVTSAPTAEEEGRARLSQRAAVAREIDQQRKAMLADYQRAGADYKELIASATDPAVSIEERDKRKQAAEAKLRELQQIEVRIGEFDRDARARLGESQRKLRDAVSQSLLTSAATNAAPRHHQPTVEKLARIRFPEVSYDVLPLPFVLKMLEQDTKRNDPDKQGVGFGMRAIHEVTVFEATIPGREISVPAKPLDVTQAQSAGSGTVGVSLTATVPLPHSRVRQVAINDMDRVLVHVTSVLRDVSVLDALDAIVKTADHAIGYTVETNRVVIHPRVPGREFVSPRVGAAVLGASVRAKAEQLILPEVSYPGLPLTEVIKFLIVDTRKFDPDQRGMNFLVTSHYPDLPVGERRVVPMLDGNGNPIPGAEQPIVGPDLNLAVIRLGELRRNQTLIQTLDAICAAASMPIAYRFEDFGVLITPKLPEAYRHPYTPGALPADQPADHASQILGVMPLRLLTALARELGRDAGQLSTSDAVLNGLLAEYLTPRGFATLPGQEPVFRLFSGRVHYTGLRSQAEDFARLLYKLERSVPAPPRPAPAKQPEPAKPPQSGASALPATRVAVRQQIAAETLGEPVRVTVPGSNGEARTATVQATEVRTVAAPPAPVAADVRRLASNSEGGTRKAESSQSLVTSAATNLPAAKNWSPAQRAILQRLDAVVFPEVVYDGLPLPEVVKMLQADARKYDPERKGFNFLLNSATQPLEAPARIDLDTVLIKVTSVVRGLTLAQVLDLVCKTASEPIQFTVEDYGIVFTPRDRARPFVAPRLVERPAGVLTPAQRALLKRLDAVVFPEITYDGLPLPEVIKFLDVDGRKHDPEKRGFNFLLNSTGQLGGANEQVDLDVVLIQVTSVLRGLTLNQVLDVVCKSADVRRPDGRSAGLQFIVEDYGIIFTPRDLAKPFIAPRLAEQPVGAAVRAKLDKLVIPEAVFDGIPLPEVLRMLAQDVRTHDPARQGVNLLTTRFFPDPPPGWHGLPVGPDGKPLPRLLDAKGNPIPDPQPPRVEPPDLDTVIINVPQVLNGLTLAQVLDVVCKTASRPITYRVEDYGVLITPKYPAPPVAKPAEQRGALPAPVGDDVRSLQSNAERGTGNAEPSQSLLTSAATIAPGDALRLIVAEDDAYNAIYPVKRDGNITVKGVGRVSLGGRRLGDAQAAVKGLLEATQLPKATVTLEFVGEPSRTNTVSGATNAQRVIYLAGEFITPGPLKLAEGESLTLTNVLLRSGGITPNGDLSRTKLLRIENGQGAVEEVNVAAILAGTRPATNRALLPGDIIMVPVRPPVVHVTGSVVRPGPVSLMKDELLTARAAILRAGGPAPGASVTNGYILREAGNGEKAQIPFSVMGANLALQARDIVVVPGPAPVKVPLVQPADPPKPGVSAPVPSPFAERGEKVAEGRLRGVATNAVAANPSPQPSPLAPQREREPEGASPAPVAAGVRRLQSNGEGGTRNAESSQSLLTPAATNVVAAPDPLPAAQEEALRQQERRLVLDKLLGEAKQFQRIKSWTNAVGRYEEAIGQAKVLGGQATERQGREALAGLTHCRIQLAIGLQEKHEFKAAAAEADKIFAFDPQSAAAEQFKRFNERVEAAHKGRSASPPATARKAEVIEARAKVMGLVRDGRLYYEAGQYQEACKRLEEAITLDPTNEAAYYYLRLIQESQFERDCKVREQTYSSRVVEVSTKWNEAARSRNGLPVPNPYHRTNSEVPFLTHSSKGAQRINRKFEEIVLPEVHFDGVPLAEVVKRLSEDAKKFDPEPDPKKKGLNLLINDAAPPAPLVDANGNPVPVARPVALSEGLIRVGQPLKNLTLRHALDVICKNAELPTQFSVEEYAIVFIPRGPVAYYSRMFRVNPDTFIQGLQGVVGNPVLGVTVGGNNAAGAAGQSQPANTTTTTGPVRATVPATVPATQRTAAEANALVRQFFQSAGVTSLGATNSSTRVFFNPENGLLVARGTTNDLRVIEQAIQKVQPPLLTPTNAAPRTALPNPIYKTNNSAPFLTHSSKGAQIINRKLDEIILPEVRFDSVTLPEVLKWLDGAVKKFDPEPDPRRKGLNFLINNVVSDYISLNDAKTGKPAAPLLDPMGNPIASPAAKPPRPDLENALIKVPRPIRNLTLRQVLDVICKTATVKMPDGRSAGLKFTVEEYAIVFSPKLPEQSDRFPRIFKVDPETFITGLGSVVDEREFRPGSRAALDQALRAKAWTNALAGTNRFSVVGIPVTNGLIGVASTNVTAELNHLVRAYFTAAGVANLGATNGPDATQVFFNDRNGLFLVRASLPDLDIIQQAIELLNNKRPQVLIEAKFVEMNQNDNKALGFDWFLGNSTVKPGSESATNRVVVIDREGNYQLDGRAGSLDQIVATLKEEHRANPNLVMRVRSAKDGRLDAAMLLLERCSRLGITNVSFATESVPEVERVPARPPSAPNPTGVFPRPALPGGAPASTGSVTNTLVRTNRPALATITGILTAPQFAVVMRALEQRAGTEVVSLPKVTTPSGKQAVIEQPAAAKAEGGFAQGLKLEVLPSVDANGYTISFTVIVTRDGKQVLESRGTVWDAQTLMVGGLELPGAVAKPGAKPPRAVLFLTPTLVDHAGNRINTTSDEMPFAPAAPTKK